MGNGRTAYSEMFGEFNFSFIYKNVKFIFIDTNSREYGYNGEVPNVSWLDSELKPSDNFTNAVVIFHVPPIGNDFDSNLIENFIASLEKHNNVMFTVHGHSHKHETYTPYSENLPYINVYGVEHNKFNTITITQNNFDVETFEF